MQCNIKLSLHAKKELNILMVLSVWSAKPVSVSWSTKIYHLVQTLFLMFILGRYQQCISSKNRCLKGLNR